MLVQLYNIKKHFAVNKGFLKSGQAVVKAVDGVDLSIATGDNLSLVGESGSGKSTLARLVMLFYPMTEGKIFFEGADVSSLKRSNLKKFRRNVQMVFQDPYSSLDPRFSIRRVMLEGMWLEDGKFKTQSAKERRILDLLKSVGLTGDILSRFPHEFSGGERQRIAIARALVMNPKLLILDEAVSSLDVIIQKEIIELLVSLQKNFNLTYLFISHNLRVVRQFSKRIAVMYKGKIVELADTKEIFSNPLHPYTKSLLAAAIDYKSLKGHSNFQIRSDSKLVDCGNNHFVIDE